MKNGRFDIASVGLFAYRFFEKILHVIFGMIDDCREENMHKRNANNGDSHMTVNF
ncbi:hypothetical protein T01_1938 [Trichinella spiralis]|uniref:Uncharacterized protein n=1 Tax=Trichinella spiralis TaxID=6334 RepID=A0A0V1BFB1_TRISP|nr:hypothetical protein T01_1938 [Trichinella spiralis]